MSQCLRTSRHQNSKTGNRSRRRGKTKKRKRERKKPTPEKSFCPCSIPPGAKQCPQKCSSSTLKWTVQIPESNLGFRLLRPRRSAARFSPRPGLPAASRQLTSLFQLFHSVLSKPFPQSQSLPIEAIIASGILEIWSVAGRVGHPSKICVDFFP